MVDWTKLFALDANGLELFIRAAVIYGLLIVVLRVLGRRQFGSLEPPELLMIVLIADGVQNAMGDAYESITGGFIVGGTIIGLNYGLTALSYRFKPVQWLLRPPPLVLIEDGRYLRKNLRREMITREELDALLRLQGVENTSDVWRAYMEPDGELSVLRQSGEHRGRRKKRRTA